MTSIVENILSSAQFKYSEKILDLRYDNALSLDDMIRISNLDREKYLRLESSDFNIDVEEYIKAIDRIEKFLELHENGFTKNVSFETSFNKDKVTYKSTVSTDKNTSTTKNNKRGYEIEEDFYSRIPVRNKKNQQIFLSNKRYYHEIKGMKSSHKGKIKTLSFAA